MLISIIDGQGGGIGRQLIEKLSARLSGKPNIIIRALGTNALATNAMIKAGANDGATGENAIVLNAGKSNVIAGVMPIVMPHSILGEVTPRMAEAVGASEAMKILIPVPRCNTRIAVPGSASLGQCIDRAVELIEEYVSHPASSLHE
ncbi:MAG: DUF3842 family protein [Lachnospiraceae bacterium]|nr:DUF3842 family protein [Lachnospiraceae bacterium]MCI9108497.1 DUF3842 family protein [Lachnospiraceae bacterium]MCI9343420.1 DUF3842 family protein [Lachnospiraceae bacterium]